MNISDLFLWGFAATLVLTVLLSASRPLGFTRMDLPFMLGTLFTSNRNNAPWLGFMAHLLMGWLFALIYGAAFESANIATWWFGAAIGLVHGAFVLTVGLEMMNYIHPRMARPYQGPTPTRQLEPPGFLALNYGKGTPLVTLLGHLVYGGIIGTFYS
ncbi:hypothetical protein [Pontibacter pudoricolor]|uniref:hypothetical protein n=1 Tax=Pontibacter pudoricolor TaxID=2694930 RepID=UPI001391A1A3|nr:hypothetical protein [Pontibacter pudoricolor]